MFLEAMKGRVGCDWEEVCAVEEGGGIGDAEEEEDVDEYGEEAEWIDGEVDEDDEEEDGFGFGPLVVQL